MDRSLVVAIVDDEEQISELLKAYILYVAGKTCVHTFSDSLIAKEFIAKNQVDLLITDFNMHNLDGLQLMESAPMRMKKVVLSGSMPNIPEYKLKQLNAMFLEKPISLGVIGRIISEISVAA